MTIIPYINIRYRTYKTIDEIKVGLRKRIEEPSWKFNLREAIESRVFEGKINKSNFLVVRGRYGLSYGAHGLNTAMFGKIEEKSNSHRSIKITVRPFKIGLSILIAVYIACIALIFICIKKGLTEGVIVCSILILTSYCILMAEFNSQLKAYKKLIDYVI